MNFRSIASRIGAVVLAAGMLPSCGGSVDVRPEEVGHGDLLKISYYRVNPEPKTKRPEPTYRVLMSRSWQDQIGENPREPLPKAAPNQVYKGFEEDSIVRRYVDKLRSLGIEQLRSQNPDEVNPQALYAAAINPSNQKPPRVITLGTDKSAKCYFSIDQFQGTQSDIFIQCEMYIINIMAGHTIKVQIVTEPREKQ